MRLKVLLFVFLLAKPILGAQTYYSNNFENYAVGTDLLANGWASTVSTAMTVKLAVWGNKDALIDPNVLSAVSDTTAVLPSASKFVFDARMNVGLDSYMSLCSGFSAAGTPTSGYGAYFCKSCAAGAGEVLIREFNGAGAFVGQVAGANYNAYDSADFTMRFIWETGGLMTVFINGVQICQGTDASFIPVTFSISANTQNLEVDDLVIWDGIPSDDEIFLNKSLYLLSRIRFQKLFNPFILRPISLEADTPRRLSALPSHRGSFVDDPETLYKENVRKGASSARRMTMTPTPSAALPTPTRTPTRTP